MQEVKKQLELLLINYFRNCYSEFPKGSIESSESPDFIVRKKPGKKLGIELVRLHPAIPFNSAASDESNEIRKELMEIVKELVERSSSLKLFVKFLFSEKNNIEEERLLAVSAIIANSIRKSISHKSERSFFVHHLVSKELPEGIDEILIVHHPKLSESVWEESNKQGVFKIGINDLQTVVQKKEEKLSLYRKNMLDEYWLLIISDNLKNTKNSNVFNRITNEDFRSEFERLLLFDLINSKVFELKMPYS